MRISMAETAGNRALPWRLLAPCRLLAMALMAFGLLAFGLAGKARAQGSISVEEFHDGLAPYGRWAQHPDHGYIWYPTEIDDDWRPYTRGHWVNTEEYGFTWVSDEEWGWAPYHYGRWGFDEAYGWYWVPGTEWGPAWVDWRHGDGHIGWAPLAPGVRWQGNGFYYAGVDYDSPRYRPYWIFVTETYFLAPRLYRHCAPPAQNITFITRTRPSTNYIFVNNIYINRSVNVVRIQEATRRPVPIVRVNLVASSQQVAQGRRGGLGGGAVTTGTVSIFRPTVAAINPQIAPRQLAPVRPGQQPASLPVVRPAGAAQGGTQSGVQGPGGGGAVVRQPQATPQAQPSPQASDPRQRQLEQRQIQERRQLESQQRRETFKAPSAQRPTVTQQHQQERGELQRIQEQRRAVTQNREQLGRPERASTAPQRAATPQAQQPAKGQPEKKKVDPAQPGAVGNR